MKKLSCILLIDDNPDDNFFHKLIIEDADAAEQIKIVYDGEEALAYFEKGKTDPVQYPVPDLILLDINMPKINGFEFLEKAREKNYLLNGKPVIIIMLTSSLNPGDMEMAKEKFSKEINDFENKPLSEEILKRIIEKFF